MRVGCGRRSYGREARVLAAVALALAASPSGFVAAHQQPDGGFAEAGQSSDANLTAWAVLGLSAAGKTPDHSPADYLAAAPAASANDLALRILALGHSAATPAPWSTGSSGMRGPDGRIGTLVNSTIWGVLALRAAGRPAGTSVRYLKTRPAPSGRLVLVPARSAGLERHRRGDPGASCGGRRPARAHDQARARLPPAAPTAGRRLRARSGPLLRRAVHGVGDPGLRRSRAGTRARRAFRYLASLRRADGSYRYSKRYAVTPVWVTSQVLPALARKPFPLR